MFTIYFMINNQVLVTGSYRNIYLMTIYNKHDSTASKLESRYIHVVS